MKNIEGATRQGTRSPREMCLICLFRSLEPVNIITVYHRSHSLNEGKGIISPFHVQYVKINSLHEVSLWQTTQPLAFPYTDHEFIAIFAAR